MKKYVPLIVIYAVSIAYTAAFAMATISYNASEEFFFEHYDLYFYGKPIISIIFYALIGMLLIRFSKEPKQTKREIVIDLLLIDLPAFLCVTYHFGWGRGEVYNFMQDSPISGSWLHLILIDDTFWQVILITGSLMLGMEIMRYISYFKQIAKI